ncbi:hypothetical protein FNV43_RR26611 [Rhamnella rubrinervis]|uniref:NB-ARC domain-containing protein n=1 Tax=Rhamnella rubrinervis TaxID=2594499 RepID=A0A8K0GRP4_9ROSA|nr:hypothetical protein FNV43_RR26611 [Rhamnella rubrinervis]
MPLSILEVCVVFGAIYFFSAALTLLPSFLNNVDELKTQIECLRDHKERLQRKVDRAIRNGEEIEADVEKLLTYVTNINDDCARVFEEQANTKCFAGALRDLVLRYRLSRKAKKMTQIVDTQIKSIKDFIPVMEVSYCPDPDPPNSSIKNKDYEEFESRKQTMKDIIETLKDPNLCVVGVCGTGGVDPTRYSKSLGMDQSLQHIAERLRNRLRKENKILVIVDDVWDKLDLEDVGISFGDNKKGCKILVTSRCYDVLNNKVDVDKIFQVGYLLGDEPKELFKKIVGDQAEKDDNLETLIVEECGGLPIAITAVARALKNKSCDVWRNALHELRNSNPVNIEGMHQKVYSCIKLSYDFLESEAKSLLLLCSLFEEDESIDIQLLCNYGFGLNYFPDVYKIVDARNRTITLVENLKDHSLLMDGDEMFGGAFVKLHDVIRDFVIYIASKKGADQRMYNIRNADRLEEDSENDKLKNSTAISLYNIKDDDQYPETLKSPNLKLLRLMSSKLWPMENSGELPHHFLEGLNELLILNIEGVLIKELPTLSFYRLQTLCLNGCILGDITWIGELQNLKILNLSRSIIPKQLPRAIGNLKRLLSLDLHGCYVKVIPPNVISSLTRLEELNLQGSFKIGRWKEYCSMVMTDGMPILASLLNEYDFEAWFKKSECLVLKGLKNVKSVAYELNGKGFPELKHLSLEDSTEIRWIVNSNGNMDNLAPFPILKSLCLKRLINLEKIIHEKLTAESFGKLRDIEVYNCDKLKSLSALFNFPRKLESISLHNCKTIEEIISNGRESDRPKIVISQLRILRLKNLPKLVQFKAPSKSHEIRDDSVMPFFDEEVEFPMLNILYFNEINFHKIWNGQFPSSRFGFQNLTRLTVSGCNQLNGVIPLSMTGTLVHLQGLHVICCIAIKEVVFTEESAQEVKALGNISFPKLKDIRLTFLPSMKKFCTGDRVDFSSLLTLSIFNCEKLGAFVANSTPENENEDSTDSVDKQRHLLDHRIKVLCDACSIFPEFKDSVSKGMPWFDKFIPSINSESLSQLTELEVAECKSLREIIANDNEEAHDHDYQRAAGNIIVFSKLESLLLSDLSNLRGFFWGNDVVLQFPCLSKLLVDRCPNMKTFSHGNIIDCPALDKIFIFNFRGRPFDWTEHDEESLWEGDINTTIQKLWEDNNMKENAEDVKED